MPRAAPVRLIPGMVLAFAAAAPAHAAPGDLDLTFGGTGKVTTPIGSSDDFARPVALQADAAPSLGGSNIVRSKVTPSSAETNPPR